LTVYEPKVFGNALPPFSPAFAVDLQNASDAVFQVPNVT